MTMTLGKRGLAALALLALASPALAGCIGPDAPIGGSAVSLDPSGQVTFVVAPCGEDVADMTLVELDEDDPEAVDPTVGEWVADSPEDATVLTPAAPARGWTVEQDPGALSPDAVYDLSAGYSDGENGTGPATFRLSDVEGLAADQVVTGNHETMTRAAFEDWACSEPG
ncbi:hypothetical protein FE697_000720 [Mumia zhuanghuii]|uniref:Uncharacterized protein n=2 Tax=Mumia TaxID=1546255 RepID=A0ABW1QTW6_9ACTN|nr:MULTISPECIES: hypothetical protein [Mumia]KAA1424490.1 hypothetical protein FE697_000720 [Mumia zhuanghuii]